jgi:hypothetical protein
VSRHENHGAGQQWKQVIVQVLRFELLIVSFVSRHHDPCLETSNGNQVVAKDCGNAGERRAGANAITMAQGVLLAALSMASQWPCLT